MSNKNKKEIYFNDVVLTENNIWKWTKKILKSDICFYGDKNITYYYILVEPEHYEDVLSLMWIWDGTLYPGIGFDCFDFDFLKDEKEITLTLNGKSYQVLRLMRGGTSVKFPNEKEDEKLIESVNKLFAEIKELYKTEKFVSIHLPETLISKYSTKINTNSELDPNVTNLRNELIEEVKAREKKYYQDIKNKKEW